MVNWPSFFFCPSCGGIHEIMWRDLHDEQWANIILYIAENNPSSTALGKHFGFTRRSAQKYLKLFRETMARIVSINSKEVRIK